MRLFPKHISGNLEASGTYINTLKGGPEYVGGNYNIESRGHLYDSPFLLRSLEHCATHIGGNLDVNGQGIYSFEYFPKKLIGNFICENNPIYPIWILLNMDKSNIELFNDFDPVRASEKENGKPILYLDVLESLLNELEITSTIIRPSTPDLVRFNIFARLNQGGLIVNGQEIRNAIYPGIWRNHISSISCSEIFLKFTENKISNSPS